MGMELETHQAMADDFNDEDVKNKVKDALKKVPEDCDSYNQLVAVMHNKGRDNIMLEICLKSLSGSVSCMKINDHKSLCDAISGMSLWNYRHDHMKGVMNAWLELVVSLAVVSSRDFLDWCLKVLVSNFMPPKSFLELLKQPGGIYIKDLVLDSVHSVLKNIADLVPLSPKRLNELEIIEMPYITETEARLVIYTENMLRLESGALGKVVGKTMLMGIVDRLIELDVAIDWEDILQVDFTKGIFDQDELEGFEGLELNAHKDVELDPHKDGDKRTREYAQKLDSLLVLTFEHLKTCYENGRLIQVFETLLESFEKTIITAYKSKFTQFVIFYACSLDPENCGKRFTDKLLQIFENRCSEINSSTKINSSTEIRMSAVAYLASYLSRAKFVSLSLVATILESLVKWCSNYCKKAQDSDINFETLKEFYAACQAIMYVLCFRMGSMILIPRLKLLLVDMHIEEILTHSFSPLEVCLPSIVKEFLGVVKTTQVFVVPDTIPKSSMAFGGVEGLDMFFPFDPCLLKKSDGFIKPNFVYWSMVKSWVDYDEEEEDDEQCISDEEEEYVENGMDIPVDPTRSYYDDEFDKMSISPNNISLNQMQMPSRIRPSTSPESL